MHTYEMGEIRKAFISDIIETLVEKGYKKGGDVPLYGDEHFPMLYNHSQDRDIADMIHIEESTFDILLCNGTTISTFNLGLDDLVRLRALVETYVKNAEGKKW